MQKLLHGQAIAEKTAGAVLCPKRKGRKNGRRKTDGSEEKESSRFRKNQETAEQSMEGFREEIKGKIKREQLHKEQKKQAGRLSFGDESSGMIQGAGIGMAKKAVSAGTVAASAYVHGKSHEAEQENAAVEGAHKAELLGEKTVRYAVSRSSRQDCRIPAHGTAGRKNSGSGPPAV